MNEVCFEARVQNLKKNWFFILSASAFVCLNTLVSPISVQTVFLAFAAQIWLFSALPSVWDYARAQKDWLKVFSALSTLGVCWYTKGCFFVHWAQILRHKFPGFYHVAAAVSILGTLLSAAFVYAGILFVLSQTFGIFSRCIWSGLLRTEKIVYSLVLLAAVVLGAAIYCRTNAFYDPSYYDVIYTRDSAGLFQTQVYLSVTAPENDLRQPLFAIFAAPFMGAAYLMGRMLSDSPAVLAIFENSVQIVLLFAANLILAKALDLTPGKRFCFLLLLSGTYPCLLFGLMMEQYITAYFWLMCCVYSVCEQERSGCLTVWGASGTLLTSSAFFVFVPRRRPLAEFPKWLWELLRQGLGFLFFALSMGRLDVLFTLQTKWESLMEFSGESVALADRARQYTHFVRGCFGAPEAGADFASYAHASWQLKTPETACVAGVILIVLCAAGAAVSRGSKSTQIALGWCVFSALVLLWVGWGTQENGLILYALYFGWAFAVLLFRLVEWIAERLAPKFFPAAAVCGALALWGTNLPALTALLEFAVLYYPA